MYLSVNEATTGSDDGLLPVEFSVIIGTNAGILLTAPLETKFNGIRIKCNNFHTRKMSLFSLVHSVCQ